MNEKDFSPEELVSIEKFKETVCIPYADDEHLAELHWFDMSIGFFLCDGHHPDRAELMAVYVRYDMQYWYTPGYMYTETPGN